MKKKEKEALLIYAKELKELRDDMLLKDGVQGITFETEEAYEWSNRLTCIIDDLYRKAEETYYFNKELTRFSGYQ